MISVKVKYYMGIEGVTGRSEDIFSFSGKSVVDLITKLIERYPSLKSYFIEREEIEPVPGLSILVNGREIMWLQKMSTPLTEGDEITFLRFVSGG